MITDTHLKAQAVHALVEAQKLLFEADQGLSYLRNHPSYRTRHGVAIGFQEPGPDGGLTALGLRFQKVDQQIGHIANELREIIGSLDL